MVGFKRYAAAENAERKAISVGTSTKVSRIVRAPRRALYQALVDPNALAAWRASENMSARVHAFDAREGETYRMPLTCRDPENSPGGKTSDNWRSRDRRRRRDQLRCWIRTTSPSRPSSVREARHGHYTPAYSRIC
jgi:hypothetical protein